MSARARARYDSYAAFASDTGLAEGWATWASAENVAYSQHTLASSGPTDVVVVTVSGTRQVERTGTLGRGAHEAGKPVSVEAYVPERARDVYFLVSAHPGPADAAVTDPAG